MAFHHRRALHSAQMTSAGTGPTRDPLRRRHASKRSRGSFYTNRYRRPAEM